jgi:His-Xaa-Ser system radical SAM maturase HxsB
MHSTLYNQLKNRHLLMDEFSTVALDLLAAKYRTKLQPVSNFTGLHIFVVTIRCNNQCTYCQVSSQLSERNNYDMTEQVADEAVEFMFQSPSPYLKVEFQGGEPLLNFSIVQHIVHQVEELNQVKHRDVEFVICTNLSFLTVQMIKFIEEHGIYISTSLDGPERLHNINRPNPSNNSYRMTVENIRKLQDVVGPDRISALMTTTCESLKQPERIVDEYLSLGFKSIFLRPLNPYGRGVTNIEAVSYDVDSWVGFYKRALDYIIAANVQGVFFREDLTSIILKKMLTPYGTGFVDLQSPSGTGIGVMVYNYNGNVYPSDESRMLAEMGDETFLLGNLLQNSYEQIVYSDKLIDTVRATMLEGVPQCSECAFRPYCGADPVRHYRQQEDFVGHKPTSEFCKLHMSIMKHLVNVLETNPSARRVLFGWV